MTSRTCNILLPATLIAILALAPIATAETQFPRTGSVDVSDLDLSATTGARAALRRIELAARRACGGEPVPSPSFPRARKAWRDCVRQAVDGAVASAEAPLMAQLHNRREDALAVASKD